MSRMVMKEINIQFGNTSITTLGVAPVIITNPNLDVSATAMIATPNENLNVSTSKLSDDIYLIVSNQESVDSVEYLIVSSR